LFYENGFDATIAKSTLFEGICGIGNVNTERDIVMREAETRGSPIVRIRRFLMSHEELIYLIYFIFIFYFQRIVYGFTGAVIGKLPCLSISASVTAWGREMIDLTKRVVEENYKGSHVIYGDTDSVMVKGLGSTVEEAIKLGHEAAKLVTTHFPPEVKLEYVLFLYIYL
jgi:hypothetical protein